MEELKVNQECSGSEYDSAGEGTVTAESGFTFRDILKLVFMGIKIAIVIYAIFDVSNLTILYQGF